MPHPSRLLAAVCAVTVILVSLPSDAGIGDKELPLLNGEKAKLLYTVVGVTDRNDLTTVFHCTSTERDNGKTIQLGIEVFEHDGGVANDIALGSGTVSIPPGHTATVGTQDTQVFVVRVIINTGTIQQGSARIIATSKNVLCSAVLVNASIASPTSMVMLPVFRATKQGGM